MKDVGKIIRWRNRDNILGLVCGTFGEKIIF